MERETAPFARKEEVDKAKKVNRRTAAICISRLIDTLEILNLMQFDGLGEWELELYEYWKYVGKRIDLE